jgi:hypothetical protein
MEIFRTSGEITSKDCEKLDRGDWQLLPELKTKGGMIITGFSDDEHDRILDIRDSIEPDDLRGYRARLILPKKTDDDPDFVRLVFAPSPGMVIRHQRFYYLVKLVEQSTSYGVAVFATPVSHKDMCGMV